MRSRSFKPRPGGPLRATQNTGGNYAGDFFSFKAEGPDKPVWIQHESISVEFPLLQRLERAPACVSFMAQDEQLGQMIIDCRSEWEDGTRRLHYAKPASKLGKPEVREQVVRWLEYASDNGRILEVDTDRPLSAAEAASLPKGVEVVSAPQGIAADNLMFLVAFANPVMCSVELRHEIVSVCAREGELRIEQIVRALQSTHTRAVDGVYHLLFAGILKTDEQHRKVSIRSVVELAGGTTSA